MKIICEKENLIKGLTNVLKVSASKTTMPILQGILLQTNNSELKLTTYDLEIGIEYVLQCEIVEQGAIVVDSRMFSEIIRKLPDSEIRIELLDNNLLEIECQDSLYKLSTMNPEEFPELPKIDIEKSIQMSDFKLKNMIKKTIFAISLDETKPIFTGCLLEVLKENVNIVAIDGFRMAFSSELIQNIKEEFKCVIPGKTLGEINKILGEDGIEIILGIAKNQMLFQMENCKVISRLLEGEFINYENVIPKTRETRIKVKTQDIITVLERASLVSFSMEEKSKKFPTKFHIEVGKLTLTCSGSLGNSKEEMYLETEGKDIEVGFNHKYMLDALKACDDEDVYIDFATNIAPCLIRPIENENYLFMVLPVRLS